MHHEVKTRAHKKRKRFRGRAPSDTQMGQDRRKGVRGRGGGAKLKLVTAKQANVVIDGKNVRCQVTWVSDNPASRDLTRRNIITKGAIIDVKTADGSAIKARVTSRPGQDGVLNAVKI